MILHTLGADPELASRVLATNGELVELMERRGAERPRPTPRLPLMERALVGGVTSIIAEHLIGGDPGRLAELEPQLVELMLMPYVEPLAA
jgi:hypothetical protein